MVSMVFLAASQEALSVPGNVDGAVVLDVDLGAGVGTDLLDHLAAGADDLADLVHVDLHLSTILGGRCRPRRGRGLEMQG